MLIVKFFSHVPRFGESEFLFPVVILLFYIYGGGSPHRTAPARGSQIFLPVVDSNFYIYGGDPAPTYWAPAYWAPT